MTDMDFSISENTQATLLLCGTLGKDNGAARPLTLPQYNAVVQALVSLNKRPSDLLHDAGLAETVCSMPVENARLKEPASADRLKTLLDRGFALSMALNRWASVWTPTCPLCPEGQEAPTKLPCAQRLSAVETLSRHCLAIC